MQRQQKTSSHRKHHKLYQNIALIQLEFIVLCFISTLKCLSIKIVLALMDKRCFSISFMHIVIILWAEVLEHTILNPLRIMQNLNPPKKSTHGIYIMKMLTVRWITFNEDLVNIYTHTNTNTHMRIHKCIYTHTITHT